MHQSAGKAVLKVFVGAALYFILGRFLSYYIPKYDLFLGAQYGLLAVFALYAGPVSGFFCGLLGHLLIDLSYEWGVFWGVALASGCFGLLMGFSRRLYRSAHSTGRCLLCLNLTQIIAHFIAFCLISPGLTYWLSGFGAPLPSLPNLICTVCNIATTALSGSLLCLLHQKLRSKRPV